MVSQNVPERFRPAPVCITLPSHRTWCRWSVPSEQLPNPPDGWYRRSVPNRGSPTMHDTTAPHTHRMVSSTVPTKHTTPTATHVSPAWCRRSVPRDRPIDVCMSLARHKDHGVAGASRDRQRSQTLLECATPGRSSQCESRNYLGFPITHNKDGPSWSVRHLAAPRSVGPKVVGSNNTFGPSWSVRRMAAPRSMGPAVFPGSPPTHNLHKLPQHSAKGNNHSNPWCQNASINQYVRAVNSHKHEQQRTRA